MRTSIKDHENQNIKSFYGKNLIYIQMGNNFLKLGIVEADRTKLTEADEIRLVNNASAQDFQDARIFTSHALETEQKKNVGPTQTILRLSAHKDGDLSTFSIKTRIHEMKM